MKTLSYSELSTFLTCEQKWVIQYVEGERTPPNHYMFFGSLIHGLLEDSYRRGKQLTNAQIKSVYMKLYNKEYVDIRDIDYPAELEHATQLYRAYSLYYDDWTVETVAIEQYRKDEELGLSGVADLLFRSGTGEIWLREHKTRSQFVSNPADIQVHIYKRLWPEVEAIEYNQLKSYEYKGGLANVDGTKLFQRVPILSSVGDQERLSDLLEEARLRMYAIRKGKPPMGTYVHHICARCDWKGVCPWTLGI